MKKTLIILSLITLLGLTAMVGSAFAAESSTEQTQSQDGSAECETETVVGAYGQTTTRCKVELSQTQSQKIVYAENATASTKTHQVADTALDIKMMTATISTIISGVGAFVIKIKQKLS